MLLQPLSLSVATGRNKFPGSGRFPMNTGGQYTSEFVGQIKTMADGHERRRTEAERLDADLGCAYALARQTVARARPERLCGDATDRARQRGRRALASVLLVWAAYSLGRRIRPWRDDDGTGLIALYF